MTWEGLLTLWLTWKLIGVALVIFLVVLFTVGTVVAYLVSCYRRIKSGG